MIRMDADMSTLKATICFTSGVVFYMGLMAVLPIVCVLVLAVVTGADFWELLDVIFGGRARY